MVGGSKNNLANKKIIVPEHKKETVFANNKKLFAIAVAVFLLFALNYFAVKTFEYYIPFVKNNQFAALQAPAQTLPPSQPASINPQPFQQPAGMQPSTVPQQPSGAQPSTVPPGQYPPPANTQQPTAQPSIPPQFNNTQTAPNPQGKGQLAPAGFQPENTFAKKAPASKSNPLIPVIIILIVVAGGFAVNKYVLKKSPPNSGLKKKSSSKKNGKKEKMVFAKDKKQVVIMIAVLTVFVVNSVRLFIQYALPPSIPKSTPTTAQKLGDEIAKRQQEELKSLVNPNQNNSEQDRDSMQDANNIYFQTMNEGKSPSGPSQANTTLQTAQSSDDDIEILVKNKLPKRNSKTVLVSVVNSGRSNPFLPATENILPSSLSYLVAPPEALPTSSDASKVMSTTISGILYDRNSPSAIINIEGADYLVKKGDVINNYKILSITQNEVIVQLGKNVYAAGVGELLTKTDLNFNVIANLDKKFGGNDVTINIRKKGY